MKENLIQKKSYQFAVRIVNAYKELVADKKEFVLSKQFLKGGTSIGANVEEAIGEKSNYELRMTNYGQKVNLYSSFVIRKWLGDK